MIYNQDFANKAAQEICGGDVVDLFDFTYKLISDLPQEAANMTWDNMHWARAVNVANTSNAIRLKIDSIAE